MSLHRLEASFVGKLFDVAGTRLAEQALARLLPAHTLMQRAGLSISQLALAIAPHAKKIWIVCGPGNNGGDGWEAAAHLHSAGQKVVVSYLPPTHALPADAQASMERALGMGIEIGAPPADLGPQDLCIDCLLGIGAVRAVNAEMAQWIKHMNQGTASVLSADLPTGLNAETGQALCNADGSSGAMVRADHTLMLLTAKPGAFMAQGRDATGQLWLDNLTRNATETAAIATTSHHSQLNPQPAQRHARAHDSHKGSYGDVAVVGGESLSVRGIGMTGAALLAATAALHGGAGRVLVSLLTSDKTLAAKELPQHHPELMFRTFAALELHLLTVVCGCGGGMAIAHVLTQVLQRSHRLVLDADALNAIARDTVLSQLLVHRHSRGLPTVLTPHPLEAARLLGCSTAQIQAERLRSAEQLASEFKCTVVLKGSGTVIASPGQISRINSTGNGQLATAGTGDVLAGLLGAKWAQGLSAFEAASQAVYEHGQAADHWPQHERLTASRLAQRLC